MTETIHLTMAQALVRFMANQYIVVNGVEKRFVEAVFSIFGHGNVTGIGEALEYDNHGIKTYRGNNEQGMAHAAIAYAKQLNRTQIIACSASIGPGALNMVTAAGVATANRIPLLLLPGDVFADRQPDPVLQQIEQPHDYTLTANDAFKPLCKYWDRITRPEMLMSAAINAFRVLSDPADTGAVVLSLPQDVQSQTFDYPLDFFKKRLWHIDPVAASERRIIEAVKLIRAAKKPLIIAGGGVHYAFACDVLSQFSLQHGIAVAETQAGKSVLPWSHEYNLGGIGTTGSYAANQLAKQADVIIAIGTRLQDFTTASKWLYAHAKMIHININAADVIKMDALALKGDARETLLKLAQELGGFTTTAGYKQQVAKEKERWQLETMKRYQTPVSDHRLGQLQVLGCLNAFMGEEDTVICAAGSLPGDLHRFWQSKKTKDYHLEYGFSCMGYEVAAGLGVALAKEKENSGGRAYVIVGDGSFLMLHSELVTAIAEGLSFTILLLDNGGFQCIHNLQTACGSEGFATELVYRDTKDRYGKKTLNIDFAKYAEALGVNACRINTLDGLKEALNKTSDYNGVSLIEIKVEPKSMSHGYESWWRVGVAQTSRSPKVMDAHLKAQVEFEKCRKY
ncbi:MAG: 3D-(3,5/4)-trihydroxycyclohexane-1,2-dione acylhydrolase (decyclizing) [Francisellaceae bacterium]